MYLGIVLQIYPSTIFGNAADPQCTHVCKLHITCYTSTHECAFNFFCSGNSNDIGTYYTGNGSNVYYLNNFDSISQSFGKFTSIILYIAKYILSTLEGIIKQVM